MSSPADQPVASPPLRRKPILEEGRQLGEAATRSEVTAALVALGWPPDLAQRTVSIRCVEGPDAFHMVPISAEAVLVAKVRRIVAAREAARQSSHS